MIRHVKHIKMITSIGVDAKKGVDFSEWYRQVVVRAELLDYYDVSGCYIVRPGAYAVWQSIQGFFDDKIMKSGVQNCYFPMLVSKTALEREEKHLAGFEAEVAWVTRAGKTEMAEPLAIRPTSETVIYPAFSRWIKSHRDLPMRLNQWCNVLRWEVRQPTPFLRSREFLWQEGHSAFMTQQEAGDEVMEILGYYESVYRDLLAIPVIAGRKSIAETFAGADYTTTVEAFVPESGKGIQGATSHCLGQNFSKMFEIVASSGTEGNCVNQYVWQNSWGLTTRTIGVMVMIHGDDKGIVLPPRVACIQVVIVPCGITVKTTDDARQELTEFVSKVHKTLMDGNIKSKIDDRENVTPGFKYNHWELRGVPIRLEVGPKDIVKNSVVFARRDTLLKGTMKFNNDFLGEVRLLLDDIHNTLYLKAQKKRDLQLAVTNNWEEFVELLEKKFILKAPWCGEEKCEEKLKELTKTQEATGAKSLCIPFEQPGPVSGKCFVLNCMNNALFYGLFGRSY